MVKLNGVLVRQYIYIRRVELAVEVGQLDQSWTSRLLRGQR